MDTLTDSPEILAEDFVENGFGDRYLYSINRDSFNKIGSAGVFEGYFSGGLFRKHTLYVVIGTDSGMLIRHILNMGVPEGSRYLFIELAHVIERLENTGLFEDMGEEIACVPYAQWQAAALKFKVAEYFYIQGAELLQSIAAREAILDEYVELSWKIDEELTRHRWEVSASLGQEGFVSAILSNVAENIQSATPLRGAFAGRTAALLAGGPSLDESLPWILTNRERLVVLALYRISKRLQQVGLVPDFVFAVDPQEHSFDVGREMFDFPSSVIFIHANHVAPILLGQWHGQSLYLGNLIPWKSLLNSESLPSHGPTVTNTALAVAQAMGFSRIILTGVDMCFSREGFSHAQGTLEHETGPRFDLSSMRVETNGGWYANTAPDYASALSTISWQAKQMAAAGIELINPSPNSARVPDVLHQPLQRLDISNESVNVVNIVRSRIVPLTDNDKRQHYRRVYRELSKALHHIKTIEELAMDALECNSCMYGEDGVITDVPAKRRMDQIEKELNHRHRMYSRLTKSIGIREFLRATRPFDAEEMDAERAKEAGEIYYSAYRNGARRLAAILESAMARLASRQSELDPDPHWTVVLKQWKEDKQYRRVSLWRLSHPDGWNILPPETRDAFDDLERIHQRAMCEQGGSFQKRLEQRGTLAAAQTRARILLKNRQTEELEKLLQGLELYSDAEQAQPYRHLVEGYLAELRNDNARALQDYLAILESQTESLLQDALLRVAHISLETGEKDNALSALECLAQLSPIYQPQYAELLKLCGQPLAAVDVYNTFLQRFPENLFVLLRLARLYYDTNAHESARIMLQHILTKHPDNDAARKMLVSMA